VRKYIVYLITMSMICLLVGCGNEIPVNETSSDETISNEQEDKESPSKSQTDEEETQPEEEDEQSDEEETQSDKENLIESGSIKVSVDYASEEQLSKYENVNEFIINEEGMSLLVLPTEELTNFSINGIEMDETTYEYMTVSKLYELPVVSPDEPVSIKLYMPDFPCIGVSYADESGMIQEYGIAESLEDGSVYLFEMYQEGEISE